MMMKRAMWLGVFLGLSMGLRAGDLTGRPGGDAGPTHVKLQAVLLDLEDIRAAEQSFTANFAWSARWMDERLKHDGSGPKRMLLKEIWHPQLQIINRQSLQETFPEEARVSPDGEVLTIQRVWGRFSQPLELKDFPYDRQKLHIELIGTGHLPGTVVFSTDDEYPSRAREKLSIADWKLTGWSAAAGSMTVANSDRAVPSFGLEMSVKREHRYHLVNVILPLAMIIGMSWVVFWINPKNANPRISVSVTAMLTLIAYRFAVGASLPKIAYLTRMDWFILGSSVLIFGSLMQVVVTSYLTDNGRTETAVRINRAARLVAPLAFVAVAWASLLR